MKELVATEKRIPSFKVKPQTETIRDFIFKKGSQEVYVGEMFREPINKEPFLYPGNLPEKEIILGRIPKGEFITSDLNTVVKYWKSRGLELVPYAYMYLVQLLIDNPTIVQKYPRLKGNELIAYTKKPAFQVTLMGKTFVNQHFSVSLSQDRIYCESNSDKRFGNGDVLILCKITKRP